MLPTAVLDKLVKAKEDHRLVAYHRWQDDPTIFLVGFVLEVGEDSVHFQQVDSAGRLDDKEWVPMSDIVWLDFETDYLKGLELLHPVHDALVGYKPSAGIKATNTQAIRKALISACANGESVTFRVDKESIDGLVNAVDGDYFSYTEIEDGGRPNGVCWIRIEVVKEVKRKTDRQIADLFLYKRFLE